MGMIGDTRAVDPLELALKDDKKEVRRDAAYALRKIGDPRAMEAAASTLKRIEYEDRGDRAYSASDQGLFG